MRMKTQKTVVFLLSSFVLLLLPNQFNAVDPCTFDLNTKGVIDLRSIGRKDGTPKWKNVPPETPDAHLYSYNPCYPFTQGSCANVAACQTFETDPKLTYELGTQNSVQWKVTPGDELPTIIYQSERVLHVTLQCLSSGGSDKLVVHGHDTITGLYGMTLSSKCACWDGCKGGVKPSDRIGGGAIFIISLSILIIVYFIVFTIFNKLKKQATGIDILPHRIFWVSLPVYALGGVTFIVRKITGKNREYTAV